MSMFSPRAQVAARDLDQTAILRLFGLCFLVGEVLLDMWTEVGIAPDETGRLLGVVQDAIARSLQQELGCCCIEGFRATWRQREVMSRQVVVTILIDERARHVTYPAAAARNA